MSESVLVTGGAGYIGTHVIAALASTGRHSISIDNYSNSSPDAIRRLSRLVPGAVTAYEADIRDLEVLRNITSRHRVDSVIHLAALKSASESVLKPERYRENNVVGTQTLVEALSATNVRRFVFSSSASVYGSVAAMPIAESAPTQPQSPYGLSKLETERFLEQLVQEGQSWRVINLRYFNPVGAHPSALIGESPTGRPDNLMPIICQVAATWRDELLVWGNDYPTHDGTGVRDYIHVMDLAQGHVAALDALARQPELTLLTLNLGTGRGYSVLELVNTFERVNEVPVPWSVRPRRQGDVAACYSDPSLAKRLLGWQAERSLEEMCRDAWRWQQTLTQIDLASS